MVVWNDATTPPSSLPSSSDRQAVEQATLAHFHVFFSTTARREAAIAGELTYEQLAPRTPEDLLGTVPPPEPVPFLPAPVAGEAHLQLPPRFDPLQVPKGLPELMGELLFLLYEAHHAHEGRVDLLELVLRAEQSGAQSSSSAAGGRICDVVQRVGGPCAARIAGLLHQVLYTPPGKRVPGLSINPVQLSIRSNSPPSA